MLARVMDACWLQHGGSGLNLSFTEAWDLEWDELIAVLGQINTRRSAESAAIKRARSGGGR